MAWLCLAQWYYIGSETSIHFGIKSKSRWRNTSLSLAHKVFLHVLLLVQKRRKGQCFSSSTVKILVSLCHKAHIQLLTISNMKWFGIHRRTYSICLGHNVYFPINSMVCIICNCYVNKILLIKNKKLLKFLPCTSPWVPWKTGMSCWCLGSWWTQGYQSGG